MERLYFELKYLFRKTPWDTEVTPPEIVELSESGKLAPGRALDLGCGTGTNAIYLAQRGWEVVGVDFSALAVYRARRRAQRAGVKCVFHWADVTDLGFLQPYFSLALDIGCLHSIPRAKWPRYAMELARLVQRGGLYMLYAFLPPRNAGMSGEGRGIAPEEVVALFAPAFVVERTVEGADRSGPRAAWYWLRRTT